ncbi:hypothetical protein [Haloplanus aerogenes]|uniref:Uncharacterized protein n=1 Tax=Haloplanus aerogenes TaxID=660522 RepID=A0A3M0CVD7_9EURY|nr:hypothetical protein [Haloplanus aerogenes]RMB13218.1 hypothetical protein ATH50_2550 [Haloplanus aerogenes]
MTENSEVLKQPSDAEADAEDDTRNHLSDVEAGAGCTEIWEHLSESRDGATQD